MTSSRKQRIGVDLGGTKIEGIVLDPDGQVPHRLRVATPKESYQAVVSATCALIEELQQSIGQRLSVGIGTPGSRSKQTGLMRNCNSTVLNDKPLQADIESELGYSVRLENDANCFALSEAIMGAGQEFRSVFGVIIGTGTGGGIVINRQLVNGPNGIAGEWGHNPIPSSVRSLINADRPCYCGRVNCIETVLSGSGLLATWQELHGGSQAGVIDAEQIADLAGKGDPDAIGTLRRYSELFAGCLATVINTLDPEAIVLGGGLSNIQPIYPMLDEFLPAHVFSDYVATRILQPLHGDSSGALGAACLWHSD